MAVAEKRGEELYRLRIETRLKRHDFTRDFNHQELALDRYEALLGLYEYSLEFIEDDWMIKMGDMLMLQEEIEAKIRQNPFDVGIKDKIAKYKTQFGVDVWSVGIGNMTVDETVRFSRLIASNDKERLLHILSQLEGDNDGYYVQSILALDEQDKRTEN